MTLKLRDVGMIGQGTQDIDRAAFNIIGLEFAAKGKLLSVPLEKMRRSGKQTLMIQRLKQGAAIRERAWTA